MTSLGFCEEEVGFLRLLLLDPPASEDTNAEDEFFPSFQTPSYFLDAVGNADISTPAAQDLFRDDLLLPLDVAEAALWHVSENQGDVEEIMLIESECPTSASVRSPGPTRCCIPDRIGDSAQRPQWGDSGASKSRTCSIPGCQKSSQSRGRCIRHGGGKRCSVENCTRGAQVTGRCKAHGGGVRCSVDGCDKSSQGSGLCRTHGGGKLCVFPGCKKGTQRRGRCSAHGGARRCTVDGCSKIDRGGGYCGSHKKMAAVATLQSATISCDW